MNGRFIYYWNVLLLKRFALYSINGGVISQLLDVIFKNWFNLTMNARIMEVISMTLILFAWVLWDYINNHIFNWIMRYSVDLANDVKSIAFTWLKITSTKGFFF